MAKPDAGRDPWVRVVIVNYNAGPLIQACVDALGAQTFADFEAVIVDNASSDGSVEGLTLPDARFRTSPAPRRGAAAIVRPLPHVAPITMIGRSHSTLVVRH